MAELGKMGLNQCMIFPTLKKKFNILGNVIICLLGADCKFIFNVRHFTSFNVTLSMESNKHISQNVNLFI